ncbi:MAG: cold shock domain-containing protein [Bacteroidetes bacterium]|nr:cold shock domain-containing protein [Bacteroidota bacterium]MBU1373384.1 cold shock domain-containing protein [Bacteroidota bacterium]MBU1483902.1 cold shock domain-containing protein [Bacteroidota bacterium]MBU1759882.1 cold shock domain-containing protein [Bacteroidota bacterium]MBU2266845.1 cold shock domain-containing protein [Bacteroidota bacterium]
MGRSQETFSKKENEKKRLKKRQEKQQKKEERKENSSDGTLENMMAYVDEYGNITDTPPDPIKKKKALEQDVSFIEIGTPKQEEEDLTLPKKGKVDFFNDAKGFGFIKEIGTQEKYFVHVNGLIDDIREGDSVSFELEKGMKGLNAVKVKRV